MFGLYAQKALVTCPFVFFGVKLRDKKMSTYCAIVWFSCNISKTMSAFGICKLQRLFQAYEGRDNQCQFAADCVGGQGKRSEGEATNTEGIFSVSEVKRWKKEQQEKLKCSITTYLSHMKDSIRHLIAAAVDGHTNMLCCWCLCFLSLLLCWRSKFIFKCVSVIKSAPRTLPAILTICTLLTMGSVRAASYDFHPGLNPHSRSVHTHSWMIALLCREAFTPHNYILVFT